MKNDLSQTPFPKTLSPELLTKLQNQLHHDFPQKRLIFDERPLIYFDNGATTLKPLSMINRITKYYENEVANVHRGVHRLSALGTTEYENTRTMVQEFLNAKKPEEIIFTKGTTDSINLVASCLGRGFFQKGDKILLSEMEHHANLIPWQELKSIVGVELIFIPVLPNGELDISVFHQLLEKHSFKFMALTHISNTLGTINPIETMIQDFRSSQFQGRVLIDGAQSVLHEIIDVQKLQCDFFVFSAHKMFGPNGVGILYAKEELLNAMPPYQTGGAMIRDVDFQSSTYLEAPFRFEAGTGAIAEVIAFQESIKYLMNLRKDYGVSFLNAYKNFLVTELEDAISLSDSKAQILGKGLTHRSPVISFVIPPYHPQDIGTILDQYGVAIRTGHHCTQPLIRKFQLTSTCRASLTYYNTREEIHAFHTALTKTIHLLEKTL